MLFLALKDLPVVFDHFPVALAASEHMLTPELKVPIDVIVRIIVDDLHFLATIHGHQLRRHRLRVTVDSIYFPDDHVFLVALLRRVILTVLVVEIGGQLRVDALGELPVGSLRLPLNLRIKIINHLHPLHLSRAAWNLSGIVGLLLMF